MNYFFCSDNSDSEEESISGTTYCKNESQELYLPDYNELVKME
jgi:hypothetical protein